MNTSCELKLTCRCTLLRSSFMLLIIAVIQSSVVHANNINTTTNQSFACFEHFTGRKYPVCPQYYGPTNCTDKYECWQYCRYCDIDSSSYRCDCDVGRKYCTEGYNPCDVQISTDMPSPQPIEEKSVSSNNNMCHAYITGYEYDSASTKSEYPKPLTCDSDFGVWRTHAGKQYELPLPSLISLTNLMH